MVHGDGKGHVKGRDQQQRGLGSAGSEAQPRPPAEILQISVLHATLAHDQRLCVHARAGSHQPNTKRHASALSASRLHTRAQLRYSTMNPMLATRPTTKESVKRTEVKSPSPRSSTATTPTAAYTR